MAWTKIPKDNHALFHAALPKDRRISTLQMFGGVAGMVNGHMCCGLFARSVIVKLGAADQQLALALDGAEPFDPMGNGRIMRDIIFMPESVMDDPAELRGWLQRALEYTVTLPPKQKKSPKPNRATRQNPAKGTAAKGTAAKPTAAKPTAGKATAGKATAAKARRAKPTKVATSTKRPARARVR